MEQNNYDNNYDTETIQHEIDKMSFIVSSYYKQLLAKGLTQGQAFTLTRDFQQHLFGTSPDFNEPFMRQP